DRVCAAGERSLSARHLVERRVPDARLPELGYLALQERPGRRQPAAAAARRAVQRVQHGSVDEREPDRDVRLSDREADQHGVRVADRRDAGCAEDTVGGAVYILIASKHENSLRLATKTRKHERKLHMFRVFVVSWQTR